MNHLVLYYDKHRTIPQLQTFEDAVAMQTFIQHKLNAGITCYEYNFSTKYTVKPQVVKSQL